METPGKVVILFQHSKVFLIRSVITIVQCLNDIIAFTYRRSSINTIKYIKISSIGGLNKGSQIDYFHCLGGLCMNGIIIVAPQDYHYHSHHDDLL